MESPATASASPASDESLDIAIIGMAGRFPGAKNVDEFWANLVDGVESIHALTDEELLAAGVPRREFEHPDYVRACPVLADIDKFDAAFFGLSPRDASVMDPAHRFFLEAAWEALENSGNTGLPTEGRVGVWAGSGAPLYWMNNVRTHREIMESMGEFLVRHTGNDMNFLATRASYDLDLRGPSVNVQTACSSALVAAHMARQSLLAGECDIALVGGSTIVVPMGQGYHYKEGEILSPDGHCRPFDHRSAGTVFGSGTACVVLKRLTDALDNGDTIHAVIKGSAINNDGSLKVGFLAPGVDGQVNAIREALKAARAPARSISYVEAHGTGTSVGDPIELTALDQAFSEQTKDRQFCGVGSVKSNIGHLGEAAAGASLIKVALALKHKRLPPSLGFSKPNPRFALEDSAFYVNAELREWKSEGGPLRAGITALGAGGTNCHLILEEPPPPLPGEGGRTRQLFVLSAKSRTSLEKMATNLADFLEREPAIDLGDVAYTLALGRRALGHRRVLAAVGARDAVQLLRGNAPTRSATFTADPNEPEVVFTFPGGGAQYAGMCRDLYENEPVYKAALDECLAVVDRELDPKVRALLFPAHEHVESATRELGRPSLALPTLFSVEYALARLFVSYGLRPSAYVGHSMGEYVAACLAGVFTVRDGLRLVHTRGRLFETTQRGKMVSVSLPETEAKKLMPPGLSIAAVNAPELCVASGPTELVESFSQLLADKEIDFTPIHIDVAAHSSLLEPILEEFRDFCRTIEFKAPLKPIVSNLTGTWLSAAQATDPEYWVRHLRGTVRFADCIETVLEAGPRVFLEIGPGRTLTTLVGAQKTKVALAVNSVRHVKEAANDLDYALLTLGKVWAAGAKVDFTALYDGQLRNRIPLPSYPFDAQSYWVEPKRLSADESTEPVKREDMDEWFSGVVWEPAPLVRLEVAPANRWLLVGSTQQDIESLRQALKEVRPEVEVVSAVFGSRHRRSDETHFECPSGSAQAYRELLDLLVSEGRSPEHVVLVLSHAEGVNRSSDRSKSSFWSRWEAQTKDRASRPKRASDDVRVREQFLRPVHWAQALGGTLDRVAFTVVTERAFSVRGEQVDPFARLALGVAQVLPRELPDVTTRLVDLGDREPDRGPKEHFARLVSELLSGNQESPVLLRERERFVRRLRPVTLSRHPSPMVRGGDVVLITGGLGGMGLVLAKHLAASRKIRLALLSREGLPARSEWPEELERGGSLGRRISAVLDLEMAGAQVLAVKGDVTREDSLGTALAEVHTKLGSIDVVIHAAGVMDDEPLQTKTDEKMLHVLSAKVLGSMHLDRAIDYELRTFVVMSSVASILGLPGQVDYTAANAFLDAFAEERRSRKSGATLAINWNAWRDVGMVVRTDDVPSALPKAPRKTSHPWLAGVEVTPSGRRYFNDFSCASNWLLAEHVIEGGDALIPGTGFVEIARAAALDTLIERGAASPSSSLVLEQVTFLRPFSVGPSATRRMQVDVAPAEGGVLVVVRTSGSPDIHMTATVRPSKDSPPTTNLEALRARATAQGKTRDGFLDQDFVRFGPRWKNIQELRFGSGEAVLELSLEARFGQDLGALPYHPALLDMATGAAQHLIPGFDQASDFYVPFGYDRVQIFGPVPSNFTSHVVLRPETTSNVASFDVHLYDSRGTELIGIEGFTMKRVGASDGITQSNEVGQARPNAALEALLREAITPQEGVIAFERALFQENLPQVIVSSVDVNVWLKKLAREARRLGTGEEEGESLSFSRPDLASEYVEPSGFLEEQLASIWSKLLGVGDVGVLDDFFGLGGNSLLAVRFFARTKKDFGVNLPLSTLFGAPTIRGLAEAIRDQGYEEPAAPQEARSSNELAPSDVAAKDAASPHDESHVAKGTNGHVVASAVLPPLLIRPGRGKLKLPLFFVHDGLGEVLLYRTLALRLSGGHPVYGLEPETKRGRFLHLSIQDMARAKVERIRSVQPQGPYLLAGLCAGGVISFEIARQLEDQGERVLFVGLIDAADVAAEEVKNRIAQGRLERILGTLSPPADRSLVSYLGEIVPILFQKTSNALKYELTTRLERAQNEKKLEILRKSEVEASRGPELEFLKLYELAHSEHVEKASGVFQSGEVVLFRATEGDGSEGDQPFREVYSDPLLGWGPRVAGRVTAIDVPGGHTSALQEPHVVILAKHLQNALDRALVEVTKHTDGSRIPLSERSPVAHPSTPSA